MGMRFGLDADVPYGISKENSVFYYIFFMRAHLVYGPCDNLVLPVTPMQPRDSTDCRPSKNLLPQSAVQHGQCIAFEGQKPRPNKRLGTRTTAQRGPALAGLRNGPTDALGDPTNTIQHYRCGAVQCQADQNIANSYLAVLKMLTF